jgi:adenylate cyclase
MEADETGTLSVLRRHRTAMATLIARHDGRIINTWGDAIIAEFASVVEAVQCAVEIQQELSVQEAILPEQQKMKFRNCGNAPLKGAHISESRTSALETRGRGQNSQLTLSVARCRH